MKANKTYTNKTRFRQYGSCQKYNIYTAKVSFREEKKCLFAQISKSTCQNVKASTQAVP